MSRAAIIGDAQNHFGEGGARGGDGGHEVARRITVFLRAHGDDYAVITASQDWHHGDDDNGGHFAAPGAEPDYIDTWPRHCVAGTAGADFAPELDTDVPDLRVRKGQGAPAYSAFEGTIDRDGDDGGTLVEELHDRDVTAVDVMGIATDYCVLQTALDALRAGFRVRVLSDLVAGVAAESSAEALRRLRREGAEVVATE